ncbi:Spy/CpxP family protein refolding chaperone [Pelomonas sp. SE-A7]|uniref:Spy/CpxP family protein refolding chaperone n=1 Tax=Pelomonas sp. SE-A7 TaxID=3054953 RepID=UPI00259CBAAF|nr:Spy/CpxP family protein refolding chaperone [Pelomonas sp. SE-A7]MDM4764909.1 Spy/CpxP family protein refolding chaperone [Pelomonas sp. SE-A7]
MRFLGMNLFHRWHHHHHLHGHHGHGRHHHARLLGRQADALDYLAGHLDLNQAQQALLDQLQLQLMRQRRELRSTLSLAGLEPLVASESFDREAARRLLASQLDSLHQAGPALVEAAADFFDSLDFEQQQALRFLLRVRSGRRAQ